MTSKLEIDIADLRAKLRAPLTEGAVKPPTLSDDGFTTKRNRLSSINPAYIIERLNDVFGENGWFADYEIIENSLNSSMIVVRCILQAPAWGIERRCFGGNDNYDRGDAYKGACSDALGKAASQLGIANEVYKGLLDEGAGEENSERQYAGSGFAEQIEEAEKEFGPDVRQWPVSQRDARAFAAACVNNGISKKSKEAYLIANFGVWVISDLKRKDFKQAMNWALGLEKPEVESK